MRFCRCQRRKPKHLVQAFEPVGNNPASDNVDELCVAVLVARSVLFSFDVFLSLPPSEHDGGDSCAEDVSVAAAKQ